MSIIWWFICIFNIYHINNVCICSELSFLYGIDKKFTFPAEDGAVNNGLEYYEVESDDTKIEGCYAKINFHNENMNTLENYPIYRQTTGDPKNIYYLQINVTDPDAPWLFTDKDGAIIYR